MRSEYSVAMPAAIDEALKEHLIRTDGQEDLTFALWTPSHGASRLTAMIRTVLLPAAAERSVHGNVSFATAYLERACAAAMQQGYGVAFLHSHPFPGWQGMSDDDIVAEQRMAPAVAALTGYPLVGLTVGSDGTWSARMWEHAGGRKYERKWCTTVRAVGEQLRVDFAESLLPRPSYRDLFRRTVNVWGDEGHARLARLRIGIVGLGSVGALVAETLARMGMQRFVLIDFDVVEPHNLDRLVTATAADVGRLKVEVAGRRLREVATAADVDIRAVEFSIVEESGYTAALDCDVLFSCVDRPRARYVLDHLAYGHLIPVIDGGIQVRFRRGRCSGADWQLQTAAPGRPCLECLGAYDPADVSTEAAGKLDDPSYMAGLPAQHRLKRNENVFPFSANLASLEVFHLVGLVTGAAGMTDFGIQRFRYIPGILEQLEAPQCEPHCDRGKQVGIGDRDFTVYGRDLAAEQARARHSGTGAKNWAPRECR
jgi:molybdopterin/thiamine biosynthesis adenylyltransferase